jgi:hypothetical protein
MTQQSHSSQCSGGDCSSFVSFAERKIAVWVYIILYILYYRPYQLYYLSFKIKALLTCTQFNIFSWQLCKININEIVQHKYILYNKSIYIIIVWEYVCMVPILFKQNGSLKILTTGHGKEVNIHAPVRHSVNHW